MKENLKGFVKTFFANGLAAGETVAASLKDSLVEGIESLNRARENGDAKFGDLEDVATTTGQGFNINGTHSLSEKNSFSNLAIFGKTGSGKSVIAAANLLNPHGHSWIVHDPPCSLYDIAAGHLSETHEVSLFDPNAPENSCGINVLDFLKTSSDCGKVASHLVRSMLGHQSQDPFWPLATGSMIAIFLRLLLRMEEQYRNMANLRHLINALLGNREAVNRIVSKYATEDIFLQYSALLKGSERTFGSIAMSAQSCLSLWDSDDICRITAKTTVDLAAFRDRPCALFLKNATMQAEFHRPLISLIIESALGTYMQNIPSDEERSIFFLVDEMATLSISSAHQILSNNRKFRLAFLLMYQSQAQAYFQGKERGDTLLANCSSKLYLTGQDMETAKKLSELIGTTTILGDDGRERKAPLMSPQRIRMMQADRGILVSGANPPFHVPVTPWYSQPFLRMRAYKKFTPTQTAVPKTVPLIPLK